MILSGIPKSGIRSLLLSVLMVLVLTGLLACSKDQSRSGKAAKKQGEAGQKMVVTAKVKDLQSRLEMLLKPISFHYDPSGKPDPFQPFLKTSFSSSVRGAAKAKARKNKNKSQRSCATPLECMDVGQLRLVAIITQGDGARIAMAQDAAGLGYVLTIGTRVGYRHGKVVKILPDRVIVAEDAEDLAGNTITRERILSLHPEE